MTFEQARTELMSLQAKMSAYDHAMSLLFFDGSTTAPKGTAANRAQTLSILSAEHYKLATGEETVSLLEFLDTQKDQLTEKEQRMVYLMLKDIRQMRKIPMEEYVAYQQLLVESDDVWHKAKDTSDFELFRPLLEKIVETNIRFAGYMSPGTDPYDFWLGEYEDGLNQQTCDLFFETLRTRLVPLIQKVTAQPQVSDAILHGHFSREKQLELSKWLMNFLQLDPDHCGLAETEHPFTTSLGSHFDERITTKFHEEDFSDSMFSVIHEGGHALYDMGSADDLAYTVLDGGVSMGIHESQSRFYENLLGRSRAFLEAVFPKLCEIFPEQMAGYTTEDLFKAVNRTQPGLIRTAADEVTYSLHILVRYELEKQLMSGKLAVKDLPQAWNALYKEYLGVDVPDDKHGVLQDIHWSGGSIGYFPSYALGSAYGAQFMKKMRETVDVDRCLAEGNLAPINDWNREHIWKHGHLYKPGQLLEAVLGEPFNPNIYLDYLEAKCKDVYGV